MSYSSSAISKSIHNNDSQWLCIRESIKIQAEWLGFFYVLDFFVISLVIVEAQYHAKRSMIAIDKKIIDSHLSMV